MNEPDLVLGLGVCFFNIQIQILGSLGLLASVLLKCGHTQVHLLQSLLSLFTTNYVDHMLTICVESAR